MGRNRIIKQKRFVVKDPIFFATWFICVGGKATEAVKYYSKKCNVAPKELSDSSRKGLFVAVNSDRGGLLWFHDSPGAGVIGHEVHHAVSWLMQEHLEAIHCDATEEVWAYYGEWLTRQITNRIW